MTLSLDHIIYATSDLDGAAGRFHDEHGLASVAGGDHPDFGTGNRIIPLGDAYIELMGITDPARAAASPLGRFIGELTAGGDRLFAFVVRTGDIGAHARRLGLDIVPGSRAKPDGSTVSWRLAGLDRTMADPSLPFFIQWDDGTPHPGAEAIAHPSGARAIAWVEVAAPEQRLRAWLHHAPLPVRIVDGEAGVRAVGIATSGREIELR